MTGYFGFFLGKKQETIAFDLVVVAFDLGVVAVEVGGGLGVEGVGCAGEEQGKEEGA